MPSELTLPVLPELLDAAASELWSRRQTADAHRGSLYDVQAGVGAILWIREATRDRDSFRACYDDTADSDVLEWRVTNKGGPAKIQTTRGAGSALIQYPASIARPPGTYTLLEGTRIGIAQGSQIPRFYRLSQYTAVSASESGKVLLIEALDTGAGVAIDSTLLSDPRLWWEDEIHDPNWQIVSLECSDGTARETNQQYLARWRQGKLDRRAGYRHTISDACVAAGAKFVALIESDFALGGDDFGINRVFVGDANFQAPTALLRACRLAVESARVLGCDLTVWGVARTPVSFDVTANLWDQLSNVDQAAVTSAVQDGILHYFTSRDSAFSFKRDGARAAVLQACPEVQSLDFGGSDPMDTVIANLMESTAIPLLYTDRSLIRVNLSAPV